MITKEFLANCTDDQINRGVAWLEVAKMEKKSDKGVSSCMNYLLSNSYLENTPDYCGYPERIMPIAFANKISLGPALGEEWIARLNGFICYDKNPLRAICEVYILMSVGK